MLKRLLSALLLMIIPATAAPTASDYTSGMALMKKGDYAGGRAALARAYKRTPADPRVRYAYALSLADAGLAMPLYTALAADTSAPDSIAGFACERLADLHYLASDYTAAAEYYGKGADFLHRNTLRNRQALSLVNARSVAMAGVILSEVIANDTATAACEAWFILGGIYAAADSTQNALDAFTRSLTCSDSVYWRAPALKGKLSCESLLSKTTEAQETRRTLAASFPGYLEKNTPVAKPSAVPSAAPASARTADESAADTAIWQQGAQGKFTLQVGSFGSAVNAQNQHKKLQKQFSDTRIESFHAKGTTFYRIRIGSFGSKEEAQDYARKNLAPKNISFSIISQ